MIGNNIEQYIEKINHTMEKGEGVSMGKKILVMTGSPRPKGNSNTLVTAFIGGAVAAGHEVEIFDAACAKLGGCHADKSCEQRGFCGQKDDGVKMNELMRWADVLVIASPVYWKGFTSQMKTAIDRFYQFSFPRGRETIHITDSYLISTAAMSDASVFDPLTEGFRHVNALLGFGEKGMLLCPGLDGPDDVNDHPEYLEAAVKMGMSVGKEMIPEDQIQDLAKQRTQKSVTCGWL